MTAAATIPTTLSTSTLRPSLGARIPKYLGRTLSTIAILFLAVDAIVKILLLDSVREGSVTLGYPVAAMVPLGVAELTFLILYVIPRTSVIGAVLWTGYLGGAVATHVRMEAPLFTHLLFPLYVAVFLWGGLLLRGDSRVLAILGSAKGAKSS